MVNSLRDLYQMGCRQLKNRPDYALDAKILLLYAAGISEEAFYAQPERAIHPREEKRFLKYIDLRKRGMPVAYITGRKEFLSLMFRISPGVLIPRPETELLVEKVLDVLDTIAHPKIYEIGTGSGNIAAALAKVRPDASIFAADLSFPALKNAKKNAEELETRHVYFLQGNLFEPVKSAGCTGIFDVVVSNPPYLSLVDWEQVEADIRDYEPKTALVSGPSGLEVISGIIREAPLYLRQGGHVCLEVGYGQAESVIHLFGREWTEIESWKDFAGIPRVISARISNLKSQI